MKLLVKMLLPAFLLLLAAFLAIHWFSLSVIEQTIFTQRASLFTDHANQLANALFTPQDLTKRVVDAELQEKIKQFAGALKDPSLFRVKIWDRTGQIVYADLERLVGIRQVPPDPRIQAAFLSTMPRTDWILVEIPPADGSEAGFGSYLDVLVPIRNARGETRFVLQAFSSTVGILGRSRSYSYHVGLFLGGTLFILLGGMYFLMRLMIFKRLYVLREVMRRMGEGDLQTEARTTGRDEISSLYGYVNDMRAKLLEFVSALQRSTEELHRAKKNVEHTVEQRTRELQEERARLQASINSLPLGFVMIDPHFQVLQANAVALTLFRAQSPLSFRNMEEALLQADLRGAFVRCLGQKQPSELQDVRAGPLSLHILLAPIVVDGPERRAIGAILVMEDVTTQKALQRTRDEFFSIASHELRTPLTIIRDNASLLRELYLNRLNDPECAKTVNDMHGAATYLIGIVNTFLEMSKLEQCKLQFHTEEFHPLELVSECVKNFEPLFATKGVRCVLEGAKQETIPPVCADRDRAKQVLMNLLGNAAKFTERGQITVRVSAEPEAVRISVEDTGAGIPLEAQTLLFHKFQQASSPSLVRDITRGTGLGLYISKLLLEAMGGTIRLDRSEEGHGSLFSFTLPLVCSASCQITMRAA